MEGKIPEMIYHMFLGALNSSDQIIPLINIIFLLFIIMNSQKRDHFQQRVSRTRENKQINNTTNKMYFTNHFLNTMRDAIFVV